MVFMKNLPVLIITGFCTFKANEIKGGPRGIFAVY